MNYQINEINSKKYIEVMSMSNSLNSENDILDLIALCWEHEASLLLIHYEVFSADLFNLKTKVAGGIIQKLINYNIKSAALIPEEIMSKGRFREMALETNKGHHFRMYENKEEAVTWLVG